MSRVLEPSDEQLLAAALDDDEDAFALFYARYERPVGIVHDGVSEVRATYPHGRSVTTHVEDNLLVYKVGLAAPNAMPASVTWLGADGHAIRRLAQP